MNKLKICVLLGGVSSERSISLVSGKSILDNLDKNKYEVCAIDPIDFRDDKEEIISRTPLMENHKKIIEDLYNSNYLIPASSLFGENPYRPDLFYISLHGKGGEDGAIQGFLETINAKYTGSTILGSAVAINKIYAKKIMASMGLNVPATININTQRGYDIEEIKAKIKSYPVFVKANNQGSSIGCEKIYEPEELEACLEISGQYDNLITIEEGIIGTEITVPVIGDDRPLPSIEIIPNKGDEYDFTHKYLPGATTEICPARISPELEKRAGEIAVICHHILGCRGISRTDMIIDRHNKIYVLETNTIPGMTPTSLVPLSAKTAGLEFSKLLDIIIETAL